MVRRAILSDKLFHRGLFLLILSVMMRHLVGISESAVLNGFAKRFRIGPIV